MPTHQKMHALHHGQEPPMQIAFAVITSKEFFEKALMCTLNAAVPQ